MRIIIGAGDDRLEGFVTCDYDPKTNPDYLFNLEQDRFPFEDNSVDVVLASHVLEHLGEGYFHCLKELYRVCTHNAVIHVHVPHHRHDDFFSDPTHRRPITVDGLRLFSKKYNRLSRLQKVHASKLAEYLDIDFELVKYEYRPTEKYAEKFKSMTFNEQEKLIGENINVVDEVYIKLLVIKNGR